MLTIQRLTSDRSAYYLGDLARELPADPRHAHAHWLGSAAPPLGLEGPVREEALRRLWEGCHPGDGRPLRTARVGVLAYDLTFSAPKSASLLLGLGDGAAASQVLAGHREAVAGALGYLEAHAVGAVRQHDDGRVVVPSDGMVAASFTHGISRQGEPHLHTHVVMANLVHGEEGRWSACDQRGLWAHRAAAGAVYEAHLRHALTTQLGTRWIGGPLGPSEVAGMPVELIGEFSSRSADIRRHAAAHNARSSRGRRVAWAATRPTKPHGVAFEEVANQWRARAVGAIGQLPDLSTMLGRPSPSVAVLSEHRVSASLSMVSPVGVRRRDLVAAFAHGATPGATAPEIDRLVDQWVPASGRAVGVAEPAHPLVPLVPSPATLRMLGPRPIDGELHARWRRGANAIDAYQRDWGAIVSPRLDAPLGSWPTPRVVDHLRLASTVATVQRQLGVRAAALVELDRGR